jgi:hypothetical protein
MDRTGQGPGEVTVNMHALFQQRVDGDDALLRLAGLRFAQMGAAAEVYADTPEQLDYVLQFVPAHARLPMVHLNRAVNMLHGQDRALVGDFADRFAGRIAGLVVHDKREMGVQTDRLIAGLRDLNARLRRRPDGPLVFLEYAAGLDRGWFVEVAERLQDADRVSCCIDVGHVGLRQVTARFSDRHPGLDLKKLGPADHRLPDLVADIQDAVAGALPHVLDVTRSLGRLGKHVHFHLHDGHPLVPGLRDHFSFLTRLPVPFRYRGRQSLDTMYGPGGLAAIVSTAIEACPPQGVSFTLEIHQVEGRLPLADAAWLFPHWRDTTNAERMNYWLSVLAENAMLVPERAGQLQPEGGAELGGRGRRARAVVLVGVEAAGDGRGLARAGERVGAVGQQGGRAGHAEPFGVRLAGHDPPGEQEAGAARQQLRQPGGQQVRAWAVRHLQDLQFHGGSRARAWLVIFRLYRTGSGLRRSAFSMPGGPSCQTSRCGRSAAATATSSPNS